MKILVTGVGGQLGYDVCKVMDARKIENRGVDLADFDITDAQATHVILPHTTRSGYSLFGVDCCR